jgi:hypothetical protein
MSDGFLFWYEHGWGPQRAAARIAGLEAAGLMLGHPGDGRVTAISGEPDSLGEQIEVDRATVLRRAAVDTNSEFSFQYWIDADIDVFCTVRRIAADSVVQQMYLDGLSVAQQDFVVGAVLEQIRASPGQTFGIIVDRRGGSVGEDWDAIVGGTAHRVAVRADLVGLQRSVAVRHPELGHGGSRVRIGDLVIDDPDGLLPDGTGA